MTPTEQEGGKPMTNYNERLERARAEIREILFYYSDPSGPNLHESTENAMAEITQLFKDLVAEAKPDTSGFSDEYWRVNGSKVILMFEANLLKALEEV